MPAKDKTYTSADIVRIWCHNLSWYEQHEVVAFFLVIYPAIMMSDQDVDDLVDIVDSYLKSTLWSIILTILRRYIGVLRRQLLRSVVDLIFGLKMARVVKDCIEHRLSGLSEPEKHNLQNNP